MRVFVMFDLPTETSKERRTYRKFRKYLISNGFMMMQQSIYCKLALNRSVANSITNGLHKNKPDEGLVQILIITEKQFSKMEILVGDVQDEELSDDSRLVIL